MLSVPRQSALTLFALLLAPLGLCAQTAPTAGDGIRIFEPSYYLEFDPTNALELVFRTPGFNPQEQDGGRGLSGVRSNILIDGERPPPKGQSIRQQLGEIPVNGVARIELIDTGARLDIDMQGYPQVVNVVLVEDAPAYYEVNTEFRRQGTGDVRHENERSTWIEALGTFSVAAHDFKISGATQERSDRSPADFVAIDPANPIQRISSLTTSDRNDEELELGAVFQLPGPGTVTFSGQFSNDDFSSSPVFIIEDPAAPDTVEESFATGEDEQDLSAEYRRPIGSNGSIMFALVDAMSQDESQSSLSDGSLFRSSINNREGGETAARVLLTQSPTDRLTVRTTVTSAFNYFEGDFQIFENGVEVPIDGSDSRVEEDRRSLSSSVDWLFAERWNFRGSLGAESYEIESRDISSGVQTDPTGDFAISYRPQARTTITLESQRRIGQLGFNQFLASSNLSSEILTAGAVELEPVRSWNHSLSYDRRFGDAGVMRFELRREDIDNPVDSVALSDSIIVAQNTFPRTIDRIQARVEYPFERFGREDLILTLNGMLAESDTIDPVTGESRKVSGVRERQWWVEMRRDPANGPLAWGFSVSGRRDGTNFSVRQIRESQGSREWSAFVEYEVIDGLKLRANLDGPRWNLRSSSFYNAVREPGLLPSFFATTDIRIDRSASISVEWRRREHFEIRASLSSRPKISTEEALIAYGDTAGSVLATEIASTPRATLRFRYYR